MVGRNGARQCFGCLEVTKQVIDLATASACQSGLRRKFRSRVHNQQTN